MTKPDPQQPNVPPIFRHQRSIIGQLYQLTLQTANTTKELERSWEALAKDEVVSDQPQSNNKPFMGDSPIKAPKSKEPKSEELVFSILVPEVNIFKRIIRNYRRKLGVLVTVPLLPRRRIRQLPVNAVGDRVEVQTLGDLVELTLHEINGPVGKINPSENNLENELKDKDLSTDWLENQNNHNHPKTLEPKPSESESSIS